MLLQKFLSQKTELALEPNEINLSTQQLISKYCTQVARHLYTMQHLFETGFQICRMTVHDQVRDVRSQSDIEDSKSTCTLKKNTTGRFKIKVNAP